MRRALAIATGVLFIIIGLRFVRLNERWAIWSPMETKSTRVRTSQEQVRHLDELLDKALADSFPASDPVSSLATDDPQPNDTRAQEAPLRTPHS